MEKNHFSARPKKRKRKCTSEMPLPTEAKLFFYQMIPLNFELNQHRVWYHKTSILLLLQWFCLATHRVRSPAPGWLRARICILIAAYKIGLRIQIGQVPCSSLHCLDKTRQQ